MSPSLCAMKVVLYTFSTAQHPAFVQVENLIQKVADEHGLELDQQLNEPQVCCVCICRVVCAGTCL